MGYNLGSYVSFFMFNTPLLLDFTNKVFPIEEEKVVPTSEQELIDLQIPVMSSPKYYLRIFYPENFNQVTGLRLSQLDFNIPIHPSLKNKVRLVLPPSIGYGIDACYRVEYWEWRKPFYPRQGSRTKTKISKRKVFEEYWKIPTVDKLYINSYWNWRLYEPYFQFNSIATLVRGTTTQDSLLNNLDIVAITSIRKNSQDYTNFKLVDDSLFWVPPFDITPLPGLPEPPSQPDSPTVAIEWLEGDSPEGEYQVTYINPLSLEDIVYIELDGTTVMDTRYSNYIYYPNTIIPFNYFPFYP